MSASYESNNSITVFNLVERDGGTGGEPLVCDLIDRVREVAAERGIKTPKKIGYGGKWGSQVYICHNKRKFRELVREVGKDFPGLVMI